MNNIERYLDKFVMSDQQNFEIMASDNTDYMLTCKDGIYSVTDAVGHIVCEFIR